MIELFCYRCIIFSLHWLFPQLGHDNMISAQAPLDSYCYKIKKNLLLQLLYTLYVIFQIDYRIPLQNFSQPMNNTKSLIMLLKKRLNP